MLGISYLHYAVQSKQKLILYEFYMTKYVRHLPICILYKSFQNSDDIFNILSNFSS